MELQTNRLLLREVQPEDEPIFIAYSNHPDFQRYEDLNAVSAEAMSAMVRFMLMTQTDKPRNDFYFAITLKESPAHPIGAIYIAIRDRQNLQAEIGYIMGVPHWNKGYTTEAARRVVQFGFDELAMHRIYAAEIITENVGSMRVVEKLAMRREAHFRHQRFFKDRWWDTYTYAILSHEWMG